MSTFDNYLDTQIPEVSSTVRVNLTEFVKKVSDQKQKGNFQGLLLGHVQSGKTSHILGLICQMFDAGMYDLFVVLTSDNISLYKQTYEASLQLSSDFNVCNKGSDGESRYRGLGHKPTVIVLSKNHSILGQWLSALRGTRPFMVIDDEADAASLNGKINTKDSNMRARINALISDILLINSYSFYLQVTATPYALFLQTKGDRFRPAFVHAISPGYGYYGGEYFYKGSSYVHRLIDDDYLEKDMIMSPSLHRFIANFLVTAAFFSAAKREICNALIHATQTVSKHKAVATTIKCYLETLRIKGICITMDCYLQAELEGAQKAGNTGIQNISELKDLVLSVLSRIKIITINGQSKEAKESPWLCGYNVMVGGNRLSRGISIPFLQSVYYTRVVKQPQMDTMWQHCRIFGYTTMRVPSLLSNWLPAPLLIRFRSIWKTNVTLFELVKSGTVDLSVISDSTLKPTRSAVIPKRDTYIITGGVNYFIDVSSSQDVSAISSAVTALGLEGVTLSIPVDKVITVLRIILPTLEFKVDVETWIQFLFNIPKETCCEFIYKTGRKISRGTGTLLSAEDSKWAGMPSPCVKFIMYQVDGVQGWKGRKLWIPAITFPQNLVCYMNNGTLKII